MPIVIEKKGSKWVVLSHKGGRVLGTHESRAAAERQQAAINMRKHGKK